MTNSSDKLKAILEADKAKYIDAQEAKLSAEWSMLELLEMILTRLLAIEEKLNINGGE
ncbi:hypothetical protein [Enterobacter pseudoroggenkampii]|uniref:hypothetical protein n=1 Tax=Enterobacter pseudoroggenkampii TaxID=2996112 RepID=UPI00226423F3|nr:hypothetical protein [Enterobacter pseudoroggenkampii]MCX8289102.1 hypothetical protein [Enterobacter pseudoroggenkampii]